MNNSVVLVGALLASCTLFSEGSAQAELLAGGERSAFVLLVDSVADTGAESGLRPLRDRLRQEVGSSGGVLVGAVVGALVGTGVVISTTFMAEHPSWWPPTAFVGGVGMGGMAGAALSGRQVAPVSTGVGTLVGSIPMIVGWIAGFDEGGSSCRGSCSQLRAPSSGTASGSNRADNGTAPQTPRPRGPGRTPGDSPRSSSPKASRSPLAGARRPPSRVGARRCGARWHAKPSCFAKRFAAAPAAAFLPPRAQYYCLIV